ncbi:MAG: winged helix-turn-helix domain-containing protein [Acidobacteriota bacterium]
MNEKQTIYEFGEFQLNVEEKQLRQSNGQLIPLQPKTFELLVFLVENNNRLLTKQEIFDNVWSDSFVEEGNLKLNIHSLRKILPEDFIETVPRHGYRFTGEVRKREAEEKSPQVAIPKRQNFWIFGVAILFLGLISLGLYYFLKPAKPQVTKVNTLFKPNKTVAVLPFKNLTKDKQDEFLSIGLADSLITKLGSVTRISVRPTSAVLPFNETTSPQTISEKLQVENILEGTIQRINNRLKISVQMVQMPNNKVLWANSFEENESDLLKIQDSISAQIVKSLEINLNQEEQNLFVRNETSSDEAYEFYLKGRYHWNKRTKDELGKSIEFFQNAVKADEKFALAYAGMAEAFQLYGEYGGVLPAEAFEKSRQAAQKSLSINPNSAEAHNSLGYTLAFYDWNWTDAEKQFQKAIELNPNYPTARQWYGEFLLVFGRFDEALNQFQQAQQLDPTSLIIASDLAGFYYTARRYDDCLEQANKTLQQDEKFSYAYAFQWLCYEGKKDIPKAFESLQKGDSMLFPKDIITEQQTAFEKGNWQGIWKFKEDFFDKYPPNQFVNNFTRAFISMRAGNTEKAFEWLEKSYQSRERWFVNLKFDPQWDSLRENPRFADLIRKANLQP